MPLYQLTLFYPNVRDNKTVLQNIRDDVKTVAGSKWRVLSAGEQVCAIVFETDESPERLRTRFGTYGTEQFFFLLAELSSVTQGYLGGDAWQWLYNRLGHKK
jgi:hypothetical protein